MKCMIFLRFMLHKQLLIYFKVLEIVIPFGILFCFIPNAHEYPLQNTFYYKSRLAVIKHESDIQGTYIITICPELFLYKAQIMLL